MDLGPSHAFSSDDKSVIEKNITVKANVKIDSDDFNNYFELSSTCDWIKGNNFKKVALQFPDNLLGYAEKVSFALENVLKFKPYILADTSYGSCCVDEVAVQHVDADCIVHYGETCMSKRHERIPVRYVLPKDKLNFDDFLSKLDDWKKTLITSDCSSLIFVIDLNYLHLKNKINEIIVKLFGDNAKIYFNIDYSTNFDQHSQIFYVGRSENATRLTLLMMMNPLCKFDSYDPVKQTLQNETADVNRMLKKRLFLVEKAKDANIVGIVIGTLSIAKYLLVLERLKLLCKNTKKTYYILSVGKLNVPKLSNFSEVDVFVLLTCPYNLIFDWSEYYRPIITPFEFEIACNPSKFWMAGVGWTPESGSVLQENLQLGCSEESKETDVSLITGRLRNLNNEDEISPNNSSLLKRSDLLEVQVASAESHFLNRSWKGLEEKLGETPVSQIKEGRSGIALEYENEPKEYNQK